MKEFTLSELMLENERLIKIIQKLNSDLRLLRLDNEKMKEVLVKHLTKDK